MLWSSAKSLLVFRVLLEMSLMCTENKIEPKTFAYGKRVRIGCGMGQLSPIIS